MKITLYHAQHFCAVVFPLMILLLLLLLLTTTTNTSNHVWHVWVLCVEWRQTSPHAHTHARTIDPANQTTHTPTQAHTIWQNLPPSDGDVDPAVSMDWLIAVVPLILCTDLREYIGSVALKVHDKCIVPPQDEPHERVSNNLLSIMSRTPHTTNLNR